jgi:hypothetical protein
MMNSTARYATALLGIGLIYVLVTPAFAQEKSSSLIPHPTVLTAAQAVDLARFDGQLIQLSGARVVHADTANLFMFGELKGPQAHVLIPSPAIDSAHIGDVVEVTGRVRRFGPSDFEHDYSWFKKTDYPDVHSGDWVIVASSVRTQEGTQLVPGNTISDMAPNAPKTKMPSSK